MITPSLRVLREAIHSATNFAEQHALAMTTVEQLPLEPHDSLRRFKGTVSQHQT